MVYYDIEMPPVSEEDFPAIEAEIQKIIKAKIPIRRREVTKAEALKFYQNEPYKLEMIQDLAEGTISVYEQGEFTDLCRGPHVPHTGFVKAIKLLKVSGAYWRADPSRAQLQRIYGTAYFDKKELDAYLTFLAEAKRRNHRKIGQALDLFSFHDEAPGMPFFHPNGMVIWKRCSTTGARHRAAGYVEPRPDHLNRSLWERWGTGPTTARTCTTTIDETEYAIKP
jgi:threonyl-tRNA synthetase